MRYMRYIVFFSVTILLWTTICEGVIKLPENLTVPAILAFGDSIVDPGNNNVIKTLFKCNFPPYGKDFQGGTPTGRFSNGKTPPDLIAAELGIKELIPAYLDPNLKAQDLPTGVSFASSGSGYDPLTPKLLSVISLSDQLKHFKEYIQKLKVRIGEEGTNNILSNSLHLVVAGSNDLANTYFTIGVRRLQYDISSYADLIVASASNFIQGNNNLIFTLLKSNFPPYGKDFECRQPTGRFSNGKTPPDLIGSGYDPLTPKLTSVIPLSVQLKLFKEYIEKLKSIVGEERTNQILTNSIFLLFAGNNDIATYYNVGVRRIQFHHLGSYADCLVAFASSFIQEIYRLGARKIGVHSIIPVGCLPGERTLLGGLTRKCAEKVNQGVTIVNAKLSYETKSLNQRLPGSKVVFIDTFNPILDVIQNPSKYGLEVVDRGCCGTGIIEAAGLCNELSGTCLNASAYLFWDSAHLTETGYRILAALLESATPMQNLCFKLVFPFLLWLSFSVPLLEAVINLPKNSKIPAVIVFGDSIVDTGNNNYIQTIVKVNYPPYGKDFKGGKPTGRFSDGKVPSDLIAEELGIKELLPAYFDPTLQDEDLLTGVNFASGGAGYDPLTSDLASVLSLSDQLEMFKDYITKLEKIAGEERTSKIISESLYIVVTGSNDITNTYFGTPLRKSRYDFSSYTDLLVSYGSSFVQDLYRLGARRIGVFGLPPLGCLPSQRTLKGGADRQCVDIYNQMVELFNNKLLAEVNSINKQYLDARAVYIDIYNLPIDLINNPQKYGFRVANEGCCGTGTIEVAFLCKYTCSNVSDYIFWDSFHLTEKAYRVLVHQMLRQTIKSFI
ncbi:hypothetical protein BUALT_Bualt08G0087600 [Buddleja alternifolia]|uniref:GDSL esterase/lipase EXL3 n=1 Tax=Buddleja alternifolia TaxID=168488 RepID=A0AAV6XFW1_9LAMI|nr:hypothetical protein BUALT_Bualt08G0087600 [Buddleja alternifolia]